MTPVHPIWLLDLLDILLVAALFYRLLIMAKGTRAAQMYVGVLVIVLVAFLANLSDLIAVKWIVKIVRPVALIAFVIVFQPELRHALAQLGRTRYFRAFLRGDSYGVLGEIVRGAEALALRRQGALVVLERNVGLRNFVDTGTRIDAKVSAALLETFFSPGSPLHDGAVIVREDTVLAAGCILPLSANPRLSGVLGTRHRAALGCTSASTRARCAPSWCGSSASGRRTRPRRSQPPSQARRPRAQGKRLTWARAAHNVPCFDLPRHPLSLAA
ncbi:MAG: diadenylate cyclase [Candidatus Eisenbacteria bacterium]|uniref:Diadenylate cyclase n=1 Tax=Eiseniibacteriota bacterium TaxID=2212470 RepID=A0A538SWK3_UNCEI|nr:MAG: diadenylate cyclase [Candidatus Eisenbacteria bacterium]